MASPAPSPFLPRERLVDLEEDREQVRLRLFHFLECPILRTLEVFVWPWVSSLPLCGASGHALSY